MCQTFHKIDYIVHQVHAASCMGLITFEAEHFKVASALAEF